MREIKEQSGGTDTTQRRVKGHNELIVKLSSQWLSCCPCTLISAHTHKPSENTSGGFYKTQPATFSSSPAGFLNTLAGSWPPGNY